MLRLILKLSFVMSSTTWAAALPSGFPNKGKLESGENLYQVIKNNSEILRSVSPEEYQYGTTQMADTVLSIGTWAKELKRAPAWVGDVTKKGGGKLANHLTHQRGLDADIAYLVRERKTTGHRAQKYHNRFTEQFGLHGKLETNFDLESNYKLFERILNDPGALRIFVGCSIYEALEAYDKTKPKSIMKNIFAEKGHEDHFHLRIRCPAGLNDCSEQWWSDPNKPPSQKKSNRKLVNGKYRNC
jgi:murein endopeptidase